MFKRLFNNKELESYRIGEQNIRGLNREPYTPSIAKPGNYKNIYGSRNNKYEVIKERSERLIKILS